MTAECLGIEYDFKVVNLMTGDHMKPEFLALNPMHNIPTMKDGEFVMNESRAIAAYLVNKYGKDDALYPKDPEVRARVDQRLYFDMGVFYKVKLIAKAQKQMKSHKNKIFFLLSELLLASNCLIHRCPSISTILYCRSKYLTYKLLTLGIW